MKNRREVLEILLIKLEKKVNEITEFKKRTPEMQKELEKVNSQIDAIEFYLDRDYPMELINKKEGILAEYQACPVCEREITTFNVPTYCSNCGQRLNQDENYGDN